MVQRFYNELISLVESRRHEGTTDFCTFSNFAGVNRPIFRYLHGITVYFRTFLNAARSLKRSRSVSWVSQIMARLNVGDPKIRRKLKTIRVNVPLGGGGGRGETRYYDGSNARRPRCRVHRGLGTPPVANILLWNSRSE